jgi:hypothetical protein
MYEPENAIMGARMGMLTRQILALAAVLIVVSGCTRATGGGEARYINLFNAAWANCHRLGLYETSVESVTVRPDGNRRVVIAYVYDNGMVPDSGRAAMLVSPQGRLASDCIVDLAIGICQCGAGKDWNDTP